MVETRNELNTSFRKSLENLDVDGRIILKRNFIEYDRRTQT